MKLNITIDLEDIVAEYDEDYSPTLNEIIKSEIVHNVKREVLQVFRKDIAEVFNRRVIEEIESGKALLITSVIHELIQKAQVKKRYRSDEMISISDHIKEELERTHLNEGTIRNYLDKVVKDHGDAVAKELKQRYDLLFASQIVTRLNDQGFLKDDVAKILLSGQS